MKKGPIITFMFLCFSSFVPAQNTVDYNSFDDIIRSLYGSISGGEGVDRDWELFRSLFADEAKLIPSGKNKDGDISYQHWTPEEYVERADAMLKKGFFEVEIHRKTDIFGNIAHLFSTYISKRTEEGEPFSRGINSIQLVHNGERWYILSIFWTAEREDNPIPTEYLPK